MPGNQADPLAGNPYSTRYQQAGTPDLDAGAPQLRSHDLRRMNQRALLLLGAVVLLLLFVAYWMITGTGKRSEPVKPREERVTVAEPPRSLALPPLPPSTPAPQQAAAIPLVQPAAAPLPAAQPVPAPPPQLPSLVQRRISAAEDAGSAQAAPPAAVPAATGVGAPGSLHDSNITSAQPLRRPDVLMQRGTYIRCVLETRIISDIPGYASCLVTEPVYSFNGQRLLLPKGSKVLGTYDKGPTGDRMAVIWDRIITPNGIDVNMASPGIDNLGGAGIPGYYDAHWGQRISSALLISMLSDAFKYEAAEHGPKTTTIGYGVATEQPFESNTAQTVQNLANQAVQAAANRAPTVTINQGTIVYVYVAKDVDFSGVVARF
ncbi:TrbI/VirB10 family protein [Rhodanobacter sp. DHB23]|uniref:TrbI/VirB10 family protein n=1 Tax=Rhodanobacter sp. DHB23 TaxID=2775923 RepID=UPI00178477AE|nr:TrbI/VirB10 family protein [Rhodanobacter sp. DHB23]MBD8873454.1 TrbI/VirB10 family protein [Rhodanobacter sp. DHB23]